MKSNALFRIIVDKRKGMIGAFLGLLSLGLLFLFRDSYIAESNVIPKGYLAGIPFASPRKYALCFDVIIFSSSAI